MCKFQNLIVFSLIIFTGCSKQTEPTFDMSTYDGRVEFFEYENKTNPSTDLCMIGDSLTQYYDLNHYFPNTKTKNRGIAGDTTTSLLLRLERSIKGIDSKHTLLLIGANNVSTFKVDYEELVQRTIEYLPNTTLYLISITPTCKAYQGYMPTIQDNNEYIKDMVSKYSLSYIDLYTKLIDPETGLLNEKYTVEGQHFNSDAYEFITSYLKIILTF